MPKWVGRQSPTGWVRSYGQGQQGDMSTTSKALTLRRRYQKPAYLFVFAALTHTQQQLGRTSEMGSEADLDAEESHISGPELLEGIRALALEQFGLMTTAVFRSWGVQSTADFGRIVFELVERGEMRKTDRDQLSDFFEVYDFDSVFDHNYRIDTSRAYGK